MVNSIKSRFLAVAIAAWLATAVGPVFALADSTGTQKVSGQNTFTTQVTTIVNNSTGGGGATIDSFLKNNAGKTVYATALQGLYLAYFPSPPPSSSPYSVYTASAYGHARIQITDSSACVTVYSPAYGNVAYTCLTPTNSVASISSYASPFTYFKITPYGVEATEHWSNNGPSCTYTYIYKHTVTQDAINLSSKQVTEGGGGLAGCGASGV